MQQFMFYYIQDVVPKPYALDFLGKTLTMPSDEAALGLFLIILLVRYETIETDLFVLIFFQCDDQFVRWWSVERQNQQEVHHHLQCAGASTCRRHCDDSSLPSLRSDASDGWRVWRWYLITLRRMTSSLLTC